MRFLPLLLAIMWLSACGTGKAKPTHKPTGAPTTIALYETYQRLVPHGWDVDATCDQLLFNALAAAARHEAFDIAQARDDVGQWFRARDHGACDPTSRDMHLGLLWYAWSVGDADLADREWSYGHDHAWVMDGRAPGISTLLPDEIYTLALVEHRVHGAEHVEWKLPAPCTKGLTGFRAHLEMLVLGVRAVMAGGDTEAAKCVSAYAAAQPKNAFFAAIDGLYTGSQDRTNALLAAGTVCPLDHLPTSADRCESYIWQRSQDTADWLPCPEENKTHSGADCLLAASIATGALSEN